MKRAWKKLIWLLVICVCFQAMFAQAASETSESDYGVEMQTVAVAAPEEVKQTGATVNEIRLEWKPVSDATAYIVYRLNKEAVWERVETTGTLEFTDKAVLPNSEYQYQVQSMRYENGNWQAGGISNAVTGSTKLKIVTDLNAVHRQSAVELSWTSVNEGVVYGVLRSETLDGSYEWITAVGTNSYTDKAVQADKTYYYRVYAAAEADGKWYNGENSKSVGVYVPDPLALGKVEKIQIKNKDDKGLQISWEAAANATAYIIYRSVDNGLTWQRIATTGVTNSNDNEPKYGDEYLYKVQSMKYSEGKWSAGPYSDVIKGKMLPAAPTALTVSPGYGNKALKISWTKAGNAAVVGIMRSETPDGDYKWLAAVNGGTSYIDSNLEDEKVYYYRVYSAVVQEGVWCNGEVSETVSGKIQSAPVNVKTEAAGFHEIEVSWTSVPGVNGYLIWRSADDGASWSQLATTWNTSYIDGNLVADKTYQYRIQSLNYVDQIWGMGATSAVAAGRPGIAAVKNVVLSQDYIQYYGIRLIWSAVNGNSVIYGILRAPHGSGNYQWIAATQNTNYVDEPGVAGGQYDYIVYATAYTEKGWRNGGCSTAVSGMVREANGLPVISNLNITQVNGNGYYVTCNVTASSPVTSIALSTWTTENGQDDIVWKLGSYSNGVASGWIYTTEHGNQVGKYETIVYATDSNNRTSAVWGTTTVSAFRYGNKTGWYDLDGSRYYLYKGVSVTGWKYIGGLKYYFYPNGVLCQNVDSLIGVQSSYVIKVNKQMNCVTIYASDGANGYVIPVKSMLCSTGDDTPLGTFYTPQKYRWQGMFNGTYAQFATRLTKGQGFLFHSITYSVRGNNRTLITEGYNGLGVTRSAGCIRLVCADAYWIYTRCALGTQVTVYNNSTPGPFYRPVVSPIPANQNYDPTDPFL